MHKLPHDANEMSFYGSSYSKKGPLYPPSWMSFYWPHIYSGCMEERVVRLGYFVETHFSSRDRFNVLTRFLRCLLYTVQCTVHTHALLSGNKQKQVAFFFIVLSLYVRSVGTYRKALLLHLYVFPFALLFCLSISVSPTFYLFSTRFFSSSSPFCKQFN